MIFALVMSIQCSGFGVQTKTIGNYLLDLNNDFDVHSLNALNRIILSTVQFVHCHFYLKLFRFLKDEETSCLTTFDLYFFTIPNRSTV